MCSHSFTSTVPSSASIRSNVVDLVVGALPLAPRSRSPRRARRAPARTRSGPGSPSRPSPAARARSAHSQWWRSSSGVGAAYCFTRTWRGSSFATSRLIAPPLPLASQPSSTTHSGGPSRGSPSSPASSSRSSCIRFCAASRRFFASFLGRSCERSRSSRRPTHRSVGVITRRRTRKTASSRASSANGVVDARRSAPRRGSRRSAPPRRRASSRISCSPVSKPSVPGPLVAEPAGDLRARRARAPRSARASQSNGATAPRSTSAPSAPQRHLAREALREQVVDLDVVLVARQVDREARGRRPAARGPLRRR